MLFDQVKQFCVKNCINQMKTAFCDAIGYRSQNFVLPRIFVKPKHQYEFKSPGICGYIRDGSVRPSRSIA